MLSFPFVVRDGVHGNIPFTALEKAVIDHPLFQRLRSIRQLGFLQLVFPSATHTRFEHSLGVMHLTGRLYASAVANQKRLLARHGQAGPLAGTTAVVKALENPRVLQVVRLAALVHDLGHGPFSHASETLTLDSTSPRWQDPGLPDWLRQFFRRRLSAGGAASHEWYSCLMAVGLFRDLPPAGARHLRDVLTLLHPDIGTGRGSVFPSPRVAGLLHHLLSSEMDGDRMDYLLRDSRAAGVSYGLYDLDRLTSALCLVKGPRLALHESGLHAFEDYLISRYQMYLQVYTHRTNTAFEEMLALLCDGLDLTYPADPASFLTFTDGTFPSVVREKLTALEPAARQVKARLAEDLFERRRPWKVAWQATAFEDLEKQDREYRRILEKLSASAEAPHICGYASRRTLSRLAPAADGPMTKTGPKKERGTMPLLRAGTTRQNLEERPLESVSYVLDGFRKPIALWRVYAREDRLPGVRRLIG